MTKNEFGQILGPLVENWTPRQKPSKEKIPGKYCILEPMDLAKHADKLFEAFSQDALWTYLPYGPFATVTDYKNWLATTMADDCTSLYAILDIQNQQPLGMAAYSRITPEHGAIEIGHVLFSPSLKQTPLATEAIYLMLHRVFDQYGYRRCEWKCNSLNEASRRSAQRFGFTFEGIFRQNYVFKQRNRDTAWFSIIDSEWPALKEKFEQWLHPNNFSASGKQIVKLSALTKK